MFKKNDKRYSTFEIHLDTVRIQLKMHWDTNSSTLFMSRSLV